MKNIYLAGKVKNASIDNRLGGWRNKLINDLFDENIEIGLNAADDIIPTDIMITPINKKFSYIGPYLYGCDHACSHTSYYAHGILNCTTV